MSISAMEILSNRAARRLPPRLAIPNVVSNKMTFLIVGCDDIITFYIFV
jgi:hypothetical protein